MASQFEINRKAAIFCLDNMCCEYEMTMKDGEFVAYAYDADVSCKLGSIRMYVAASDTEVEGVGVAPVNVKESARPAVAEYLTRINYGLKVGNFEMDFSDGKVRYKSLHSSMNGEPCREDVERIVECPAQMFSVYGDGLLDVMFGICDPETAYDSIDW